MRRLPSASWRCSVGRNVLLAGQASVPSGWRAKSCPENRPAILRRATAGAALALHRRLLCCGLGDGGSKLGRAHRRRLKHMPQFQTEGPDPLRDNLPRFLESRAHENTTGRGLAPGLHRPAPVQSVSNRDIILNSARVKLPSWGAWDILKLTFRLK